MTADLWGARRRGRMVGESYIGDSGPGRLRAEPDAPTAAREIPFRERDLVAPRYLVEIRSPR